MFLWVIKCIEIRVHSNILISLFFFLCFKQHVYKIHVCSNILLYTRNPTVSYVFFLKKFILHFKETPSKFTPLANGILATFSSATNICICKCVVPSNWTFIEPVPFEPSRILNFHSKCTRELTLGLDYLSLTRTSSMLNAKYYYLSICSALSIQVGSWFNLDAKAKLQSPSKATACMIFLFKSKGSTNQRSSQPSQNALGSWN